MKRISRLVMASSLFLASFSPSLYGGQIATSTGLLSVINKDFEVYAPRAADLERASQAILHARSIYQKYYGKDAPKIALVLYDIPDQASDYDQEKFKKRGMALLKWGALTMPSKNVFSGDLGAILTESWEDGRPQILDFYSTESVPQTKFQKGDKFLKINSRQLAGVEDLHRQIGAVAVGNEIILLVSREGREMELKITKSPAKPFTASSVTAIQNIIQASGRVPVSKGTVSHEVMHKLMREGQKDSINIPAWFSEGLAALAEFPEDIRQRRLRMAENLKERIPLTTLFTMPHPASGGTVVSPDQRTGGSAPGLPVRIMSNSAGVRYFYEQSMTILSFLADAEGERFIGRIGESLGRGENMEKALGLAQKAPSDLAQLEAAWMKWLSRE